MGFLKKAFSDMAESAKAQHEVDKANFAAAKAESKANFEENRGRNSFARAMFAFGLGAISKVILKKTSLV